MKDGGPVTGKLIAGSYCAEGGYVDMTIRVGLEVLERMDVRTMDRYSIRHTEDEEHAND